MLREIEYEKDLPVKVQVLQIQQCPWHIHDDIQIIYVLEGEVELKLTYALTCTDSVRSQTTILSLF